MFGAVPNDSLELFFPFFHVEGFFLQVQFLFEFYLLQGSKPRCKKVIEVLFLLR